MARRPFFPRYRTVRTVPWWWPIVPPLGLAFVVAWLVMFIYLLLGGSVVPR